MITSRRQRHGKYALGVSALLVAAITCSDATAPGVDQSAQVVYAGPPALINNALQVIVGQRLKPAFEVRLGTNPVVAQPRARYVLSLPNLADTSVLRIFGNGDSVEVLGRGTASLKATLVGVTVGISRVDTARITVIATPAANSIDSTSLTFNALGVAKTVRGSSLRQDGTRIPLTASSLTWTSADPLIAGVTKLTDSTAVVTSLGNGTTTITATFDGIDLVALPVTVQQAFSRFQLSTGAFGTGEVTLVSLGEQITVSATALDPNGQMMLAGSLPVPTPNFASTNSGRASVSPVSGVVTAIDNTDPIAPARIYATAGGTPRSDSLDVVVRQRAVSIVISGLRSDTIKSIGATKNYVAVARDANNRDLPPSFITWSTNDQTIAQANGGPPVVVTGIGVGTTRLAASRPADNVGDTITLVVTNDPASIALLPDSLPILSINDTVRFASVTVRNTKGDVLPGAAITWISLNPAVVEAVPDGRMVSHTVGSTFVIARTANGLADTSRVVVTNAPETLDIIPVDTTMTSTGDTITVPVDFRNSRGVALPPSSAAWSSSDASVVRVAADGSGRIFAIATGDAYVLAVSPVNPARRDSVLVTVTNAPAAITTSPSSAQTLTAFGTTLQFSATVFNAKGNPIPNATVRWTVPVGSAFVTIDSVSGLLTAVANGTATVRARSGTVTHDVPVTVAQAFSPTRSTIIPARNSIAADGADTTTVTIQLRDANDNNYVGTAVTVVPSTSRGTLSPLTNQGNGRYTVLLTAGTASGPATIAATVNSVAISNTALVNFMPGAATQYVVVILPNASPLAGDNVTIVAQLADQFGNAVTNQVKTITWTATGGGTFTPATPQTTSNGRVIVTFTTSTTPATVHTITATDNTAPTALTGSAAAVTRSGGPTRYLVGVTNSNPVVGDTVTVIARLVDANGNFERIPGRTVTWSSVPVGQGGFSFPTAVTDGDGIAWGRFAVSMTGGVNHRVTANDGVLQGTSAIFTTVVPTQYIVTAPTTATAGTPVIIAAQLADAGGNPVRQAGRTVAWSVTTAGQFATPTALTDGNGVAYIAYTGTTAGIHRVRATDQLALTGQSGNITVGNGAAAQLVITTQPSTTAMAGVVFSRQPIVHVYDAFGNIVVGDNSTQVTAARAAGTGALGGTVTGTAVNGVVTFTDLQYTVAETMTIGFTSTPALTGVTSSNVVVSPNTIATFGVRRSPGGPIPTETAGTPFDLELEALDGFGNRATAFTGTVVITGGAGTTLQGQPITSAPFVAGLLEPVSVTVTSAGAGKSITVTRTAGTETGTSNAFTVNAGALDNFLVEATGGGAIGTQTAGTPFNVRVTARDIFNNTVPTFTGTVTFTSTSTIAAGAGPSAAFIGGVLASHSITLNTSGSHTITATGGGRNGTSAAFTVNPTAAVSFVVTGLATQAAGVPQTVSITARDVFGNTATSYTGLHNLVFAGANTAPDGTPPTATDNAAAPVSFGGATSVNFTNGVGTSAMALYLVENATISVSAAGPLNTSSALAVAVTPGTLARFTVTNAGGGNIPDIPNPGGPASIDITALDAYDNVQTGFVGTVDIDFTPSGAQVSVNPGTSGAFTAGRRLGQNLTINDTSLLGLGNANIQIRVQNSAGAQFGLSNVFNGN